MVTFAEGTEANPSSPYTRKRASSFLKSLKSKLSTHTEEEEEEEKEEEQKQSHVQDKEDTPQSRPRSTIQRSQSVKTRGQERRQKAMSSNGTTGHLDLARSSSADSAQQGSNSAGKYPHKSYIGTGTTFIFVLLGLHVQGHLLCCHRHFKQGSR